MAGSISILLAQRKSLSTELLVSALSSQARFKVVSSVDSSDALISAVRQFRANVVLLSAELDDSQSGTFDLVQRVRLEVPRVRIVMLFEKPERELVVHAFRSGVRGVFGTSRSDYQLLCKCVEKVHVGQVWASNEELGWVVEAFEASSIDNVPLRVVNASGISLLSKREEDVVKLVANGLSNREIAQYLNLSQHTVKNYLFRVFDKLGVSSRTELLIYAMASSRESSHLLEVLGPALGPTN